MCIRDSVQVAVSNATFHFDKLYSYSVPAHLQDRVFVGSMVLVPVSYTHLDVYKRQALEAAAGGCCAPNQLIALRSHQKQTEVFSMSQHPIEGLMDVTLEKIKSMVDSNTKMCIRDSCAPLEKARRRSVSSVAMKKRSSSAARNAFG